MQSQHESLPDLGGKRPFARSLTLVHRGDTLLRLTAVLEEKVGQLGKRDWNCESIQCRVT